MTNLLEQAISCNDGDLAAKMIRNALGIETDDVTNYCFPKDWPDTKEQLRTEADWSNRTPRHLLIPNGDAGRT